MAYKSRKEKLKEYPEAYAHIYSTQNNTIITITDKNGDTISWASAGTVGYKGAKKETPFAAGMAAEAAAKSAMEAGVKKVELFVKGLGPARETAMRSLQSAGLDITAINMLPNTP